MNPPTDNKATCSVVHVIHSAIRMFIYVGCMIPGAKLMSCLMLQEFVTFSKGWVGMRDFDER